MESQEKPLLEFEDELRYITFGLFGCSFERYKHCVLKNGFLLFHLEKGQKSKIEIEIEVRNARFSILKGDEWRLYNSFPEPSEDKVIQICKIKEKSKINLYYFFTETNIKLEQWKKALFGNGCIYDETLANQKLSLTRSSIDLSSLWKKDSFWFLNQEPKDEKKKKEIENKKTEMESKKKKQLEALPKKNQLQEQQDLIENLKYEDRFFDVETVKKIIFTFLVKDDKAYDNIDGFVANKDAGFPIKLFACIPKKKATGMPTSKMDSLAKRHEVSTKKFSSIDVGLQIRDKIVRFKPNNFVKIEPLKGKDPIFLISISVSGRLPLNGNVETVIAETIVKWNKYAIYEDEKHCTNQAFVENMISEINSKCNLPNAAKLSFKFEHNTLIKDYFDYLRYNPGYQKKFFIDKIGIRHVFSSHAIIDKWHNEQEQQKDFLSSLDKEFLKGFHRAFQLKEAYNMAKSQENENENNLKPIELEPCEFGNPTVL